MSSLFLKQFKGSEKRELNLEDWEGLTVKKLRESACKETGIPLEELTLIFNGRVLKLNNSLSYYKLSSGCTIYYTRKAGKASSTAPQQESQEQNSAFQSLISNRRVLAVIGRILSNPSLLQAMLVGTPLEGNQAVRDALTSPELLSSLSDPATIEEYLRENPHMASMMESMLRVYQYMGGDAMGGVGDEAVEMVEESLEDDIEEGQQERIRVAQEQEQMFEHSQAIHAHQRQAHPSTSTGRDSSGNQPHPSSRVQRQNSGGPITQDYLASALAGAMGGSQPSSQPSSLDVSNSGPPSLSAYGNQQATTRPVQVTNGSGRAEQVGSITQQPNITSDAFQQALATAISNIPTPSSSSQEPEQRLTPQEKYRAQLEQLHFMGILDDRVSIQALEAAEGDLQAALEIIYTS